MKFAVVILLGVLIGFVAITSATLVEVDDESAYEEFINSESSETLEILDKDKNFEESQSQNQSQSQDEIQARTIGLIFNFIRDIVLRPFTTTTKAPATAKPAGGDKPAGDKDKPAGEDKPAGDKDKPAGGDKPAGEMSTAGAEMPAAGEEMTAEGMRK